MRNGVWASSDRHRKIHCCCARARSKCQKPYLANWSWLNSMHKIRFKSATNIFIQIAHTHEPTSGRADINRIEYCCNNIHTSHRENIYRLCVCLMSCVRTCVCLFHSIRIEWTVKLLNSKFIIIVSDSSGTGNGTNMSTLQCTSSERGYEECHHQAICSGWNGTVIPLL